MGATRDEIAAELLKASKDVKAAERRYQGTERVERVRYCFIGDFHIIYANLSMNDRSSNDQSTTGVRDGRSLELISRLVPKLNSHICSVNEASVVDFSWTMRLSC